MAQLSSLGSIRAYEKIRQDILHSERRQPFPVLDCLGFAHGCFATHQLMAVLWLYTITTTIILAELFHVTV